MHSNGHTARRVEATSFCTLTSHILLCKVSLSSALSCHGVYSQHGGSDGKSGIWDNKELDMAVWLFTSVSFAAFVQGQHVTLYILVCAASP